MRLTGRIAFAGKTAVKRLRRGDRRANLLKALLILDKPLDRRVS
jgi:hypothetical protein